MIFEQGTLIALASFAEGKQIDKVRSAVLLSPIAYLSHMNTALGVVATRAFVGEVSKFSSFFNNHIYFHGLKASNLIMIMKRGP